MPAQKALTVLAAAVTALFIVGAVGAAGSGARISVGSPANVSKQAGYNSEGTIAVNPTDPTKLFAAFNNTGSTDQWARSTDSGATWTTSGTGVGIAGTCCDNVAEWDRFGNLYLVNINAGLDAVPLSLSVNNGALFTPLWTFGTGSVGQPTVKAGPDSVWVTWNDNGTIEASGSIVTGLGNVTSFSAPQAALGSDLDGGCQFGDIAVGPAGQVVDVCQTDTEIKAWRDTDGIGGSGFTGPVDVTSTNVDKSDAITPQPNRAIDAEANLAYDLTIGPHAGRLYMVYTDEIPDESNNTDIFIRHSDDNGATWSPAVKVNDDATTSAQFLPVVSVDPTSGNVFVSFLDARNDPNNQKTEYWGAISKDGGNTFDANVQLSNGQSQAAWDGNPGEYGGYSGNDYFGSKAYGIWPDNSNTTGDNPDGAQSHFDMYTAQVSVPNPPTIRSFSPSKGASGTTVTIKGSAMTGATAVQFHGLDAFSFTVTSDSQISAIVPVGATTGPISVTNPGGTGTSTKIFTVQLPKAPKVTKLTPASGPVGTTVVIKGTGLFGASAVTFNGTPAQSYTVNSAKQITAVVAVGTTTGFVVVTAPGGNSPAKKRFTVT